MSEGLSVETIEKIEELAVEAAGAAGKAATMHLPAEPNHVYGLIKVDGSFERVEAAPQPRAHHIISLDEAVTYAKEKGDPTQTVVWFDRGGVVILLDDSTRRDRAELKLNFTPPLKLLAKIEKEQTLYDQRDFYRLLKIDLASCRQDTQLLNWVSEMQFTNQSEARGMVGHGRESMGKDLDVAAASDLGECPEEILLKVRVFDDPAQKDTWPVRCAVEVLAREQKFRLVPLPLELHNAIEDELFVVGQKLREGLECRVYRGTP